MAFYLSFPLLALTVRRGRLLFAVPLALSIGLAGWFAFRTLDPGIPIASQWAAYVNPLNQLVLFFAGIGVSTWIGSVRLSSRWTAAAMAAGILAFLHTARDSSAEQIVAGPLRIAYIAVCVAICSVGALGTFHLPRPIDEVLEFLGRTSYASYLLHPMCYAVTAFALRQSHAALRLVTATSVTLLISYLVYRWLEAPAIRLGKRLADRIERRTKMTSVATGSVGQPRAS